MPSLNNLRIIGNLGADPLTKVTKTNKIFSTFRVAINTGTSNNKKTEWFSCIAWGLLAEDCQNLKKGELVFLEGEIVSTQYNREVIAPISGEKFSIPETKVELQVSNILDFSKEQQKSFQEEMPEFLSEKPDFDNFID